MTDDDALLVQALNAAADRYDEAMQPASASLNRIAARRIAELSPEVDDGDPSSRCKGCGVPLLQPATGRRRRWCPAPSCQEARKHPGKTRQNVTLAS